MVALEDRVRAEIERRFGDADNLLSSPTVMFARMGELNTRSSLLGALAAVILISIILTVALRSWRLGALSLLPNLIPTAVGFGVWAVLYGELGMSLAMVAGMTLGIVVDDTVHKLTRYLGHRRAGQDAAQAVGSALEDVGNALVFSTAILSLEFAMLTMGEFRMNSDMGVLTSIIIVAALLFDLYLLPALLVLMDRTGDKPSQREAGAISRRA